MQIPARQLKSGKTCPVFYVSDHHAKQVEKHNWHLAVNGRYLCGRPYGGKQKVYLHHYVRRRKAETRDRDKPTSANPPPLPKSSPVLRSLVHPSMKARRDETGRKGKPIWKEESSRTTSTKPVSSPSRNVPPLMNPRHVLTPKPVPPPALAKGGDE